MPTRLLPTIPAGDVAEVQLSRHAADRCEEMGVDHEEVIDAVTHPEITLPDKGKDNATVAIKGRLKVPYERRGDTGTATVITVMWAGRDSREEGPVTPVPNKPSNRKVWDQMLLWGCEPGRNKGDYVQMRIPDGDTVGVRRPEYSIGNSSHTLRSIYAALGVSAEKFWAREEKVRRRRDPRDRHFARPADLPAAARKIPPPPPKTADTPVVTIGPPDPPKESQQGRLLAYYRGHPGQTIPASQAAEALGLPSPSAYASVALLANDGRLQRVGRGQYRCQEWGATEAQKRQAAADLAWVTDPANHPQRSNPEAPKRSATTGRLLRPGQMGTVSRKVLAHFEKHRGEALTTKDVCAALQEPSKATNNALRNLAESGQLQKIGRGQYLMPLTPAATSSGRLDPLARLDQIQAELDAAASAPATIRPEPTPEPDLGPVPQPLPDPGPVTPATPTLGEQRWEPDPAPATNGHTPPLGVDLTPVKVPSRLERALAPEPERTVDDEIDALLELLAPNGLKARHLQLAVDWCDATRELLTATREGVAVM